MNVKIELVLTDGTKREEILKISSRTFTGRTLDVIDRAVEKKFASEPWVRWNFLGQIQ